MKPRNLIPKFQPAIKWSLLVVTALQMNQSVKAEVGGAESFSTVAPISLSPSATDKPAAGSVIALNRDVNLNGRVLPRGSELIVNEDGKLSLVEVNEQGEATETAVDVGAGIDDLFPFEFTLLNQDEETGEIAGYNLPDDYEVAGPGRSRRKRGGVTNCYHVVKQIVRRRITLTGVAAYMAAPQLQAAGWQRYGSYQSAPGGSVCVFGAGGKVTSSGGHKYGHIGVKGAGGIANPTSGFHLNRPFLGCWHE